MRWEDSEKNQDRGEMVREVGRQQEWEVKRHMCECLTFMFCDLSNRDRSQYARHARALNRSQRRPPRSPRLLSPSRLMENLTREEELADIFADALRVAGSPEAGELLFIHSSDNPLTAHSEIRFQGLHPREGYRAPPSRPLR